MAMDLMNTLESRSYVVMIAKNNYQTSKYQEACAGSFEKVIAQVVQEIGCHNGSSKMLLEQAM